MIIAVLTFSVLLHDTHSLKEKRAQIKPLLSYLRKKFNVSAAEIEFQDKWGKSSIACAQVGNDHRFLESSLMEITNHLERKFLAIEFIDQKIEFW